jgi:hypothetical protein
MNKELNRVFVTCVGLLIIMMIIGGCFSLYVLARTV